MKDKTMNKTFHIYCLLALFVAGCQPTATSYSTPMLETQVSTNEVAEMQVTPTSQINSTFEPSPTGSSEIVLNKIPIANNSKIKLNNQCINITNVSPVSNSIIVLRSLKNTVPHEAPDIILMDMSEAQPRETIQKTGITPNFAVSPNGELIAYLASTITNGEVTQLDLVIADGNFQTQNSIPWDDQWHLILGWTADQKVIISSSRTETTSPSFVSYILIDPINGEQQAVQLSISDFIDESLYDAPYWENWYGILMDPTFKWAVYPKQSTVNAEMYTYALWNISSNKPMFSLEKVFSSSWFFIHASPMPSWSIDGKQLAFVGQRQDEPSGEYELFLVNVNGDIKRLTNLSSIGYVWPSFHSWSPDNNYIAFFISPPQAGGLNDANVAMINARTFEVIDLCLSVGLYDSVPIWSPDGKQFLIVDKHEKDNQRVLLVDIEEKVVFPIAENVEPIGWMTKP